MFVGGVEGWGVEGCLGRWGWGVGLLSRDVEGVGRGVGCSGVLGRWRGWGAINSNDSLNRTLPLVLQKTLLLVPNTL